jgi:TPR repeat protein
MTYRTARFAVCLAAWSAGLVALAGTRTAQADSAQLNWEYQCLKDPDAVCFDATPSGADPLMPKPAPAAAPADLATADTPPGTQTAASPTVAKPAAKSASAAATADALGAIAGHLRAGKPTPGDMAALQARARQGHVRALELLGWAELFGIGVARDPVQAYFHYGMAAAAGLPTGRRDQAAIFTNDLTNEERQQILLIENGNLAAGGR